MKFPTKLEHKLTVAGAAGFLLMVTGYAMTVEGDRTSFNKQLNAAVDTCLPGENEGITEKDLEACILSTMAQTSNAYVTGYMDMTPPTIQIAMERRISEVMLEGR